MVGFIPEEIISEIQHAVDIVDIVSEAVLLKKAGRNYQGLCPFHSEKAPSFTVSQEKQIFYCFGCGAGGNVFSFLMKQDGLTFVEAVEFLARRAGVELPEKNMSPEMKKRVGVKEKIYAVNKAALEYFQKNLKKGHGGKKAERYLQKRGFEQKVIEAFQIGFAPRGWDGLVRFFSRNNQRSEIAEKAGLVAPRRSGRGHYDRFRERIIFPIFNTRNRLIGFGGRVIDDSMPKYLNSPETLVFSKSQSLYGLHLTKSACRRTKTAYVVEGYFDVIALYQHGIENVVGTLGTSLTIEHAKLIKSFAEKVILVFDSDEAGVKAAKRSIAIFRKENLQTRVMTLPRGYDPDSFVFEFGAEAFYKASKKAHGVISFLTEASIAKHGMTVEGKLAVLEEMKEPLGEVQDPAALSLYVKAFCQRLEIEEEAVLESIRRTPLKKGRVKGYVGKWSALNGEGFNLRASAKEKTPQNGVCRAEKDIISMMLQCPDILPDIVTYEVLDYFKDNNLKSIGKAVLLNYEGGSQSAAEPSALFPFLHNEAQRGLAASLSMSDEDCWVGRKDRKRQLIFQFIESRRLAEENVLLEKIKEAEAENDMDLLTKLLAERQKMALVNQEQKLAMLKKRSSGNSFN